VADCEIVSSYGLLVVVACKSRMEGLIHTLCQVSEGEVRPEREDNTICV
jgi:hypothetical protein